ncbi:MAG: 1-acyl-sn-glycerol-3-phosphate acyltransferase [Phycisphaeraceae bacterium]|nr:1-acyl-sn-glycerol-3-phosphate acyltransferase [Phycisphaeraceae bacterium]
MPEWLVWMLMALLGWMALVLVSGRLLDGPRGDDVVGNLSYHAIRGYVWLRHRPTVEGREHVPGVSGGATGRVGPLIVVANHASGVDPLLIQAVLPFEPRWVMASDMRHPMGEWLWRFAKVIFVDRDGGDPAGVREALRHLGDGGVLGLFPEGGIERRERTLRPFQPGIGLLVRRSGARVLPIVIEGATMAPTAWGALLRTSRPRIRVMPVVEYDRRVPLAQVATDLQSRYERWTGWGVE